MSRVAISVAAALVGCTTMQSSRTLAPGRTQVSVGATRFAQDRDLGQPLYLGEVRVAHGVSDTFEIGGRLDRTPGAHEAYSAIGIDPKWQISSTPTSWVSLAVPVSVLWHDQSLHDPSAGTFVVTPTLYAGTLLGKNVEGVFAPRVGFAKAYSGGDPAYGFGANVGLRFGDPATRSALQPEMGIFHELATFEGGEGTTILLIGIGVTAGD